MAIALAGDAPVERAVESLRPGDLLCLWQGGSAAILTIDTQRIDIAAHPTPSAVAPVLVRAGALAPGVPSADLILPQEALVPFPMASGAPESAVPRLVPIGALTNTQTILRQPAAGIVSWHAIQLASQAILLANAAPVASLRGAQPPSLTMLPAGSALLALRASLARRGTRPEFAPPTPGPPPPPWIEPDPARPIRLFIEGQEIPADPASTPTEFRFALPPDTGPVRLVAHAHDSPAPQDKRRLGICVIALLIDDTPLALDGPTPGPGFHPMESKGTARWRWTDGEAWIVLPHSGRPRRLRVTINDWHLSLK